MGFHRLTDLRMIRQDRIDAFVAAGDEIVIQFSRRPPDSVLRDVESLCARHGDRLRIRFYGYYDAPFDGSVLRALPSVVDLTLDCLYQAARLEEVASLGKVRRFGVGLHRSDCPGLLSSPNLRNLSCLRVQAGKPRGFDLAPVGAMPRLRELTVAGVHWNLAAVGEVRGLRDLRLSGIGKEANLRFVNGLSNLRSLRLFRGGRPDMDEVSHPGLQTLEIDGVLGLSRFDPSRFPGLRHLEIEAEGRLRSLRFSASNRSLRRLCLFRCKSLSLLKGLGKLAALRAIRIGQTALEVRKLLSRPLPPDLKEFAFFTGRRRDDAAIRARLDALGYTD